MIKNLMTALLIICALSAFTADDAAAQYEVKDSFYFMKGDGEFSDAEKDEEALYVFNTCQSNAIQSLYFDCACIAGAFRQERDSEKLVPQSQIINALFNDNNSQCANTIGIAGDAYESCQEYSSIYRARNKDNNKYCKCVANKTALNFQKKPILNTDYIRQLRSGAMLSCK